ncbi:MAG: regulatory protein RecX [Clostridia bacterium]|nr:regulatory protein RecX [Clostridia bacterium]
MIDCREYALKLITFRDRTRKELRDKLTQKGYDENTIEDVIAFLEEYGYINDFKYAQHFINDCVNLKKWGKIRIRSELLKRGVKRDVFESILEEAFQDGSDDMLINQIETRFKNSDLGNVKERTRIFNFFLRRGYCAEEIKGALNQVCSFKDIVTEEYF